MKSVAQAGKERQQEFISVTSRALNIPNKRFDRIHLGALIIKAYAHYSANLLIPIKSVLAGNISPATEQT